MLQKVRARYSEGSLTPLTPLDLSEGEIVSLTVEVESKLSKEERAEKVKPAADLWTEQEDLERIRRAVNVPKLSTNEWLEKVRKRKEASRTRITAAEILEARDADRK
ncbi:MAG: DUF104 domain-containing protein [Chloroflexi bacterium]|nr:DUF104 domain-containing protein [Chloroflexota bacterium]